MAESLPFGRSIDKGSDNMPDNYCEPCHELKDEIKPLAGHCVDCGENLCIECFNYHRGPKPFRNHKLVDKSAKPRTQMTASKSLQTTSEICSVHGATIQSFCKSHSELCCKVCRTINHKTCDVEEISKMAKNIHDFQELQTLNKKLKKTKKGFEENLKKAMQHKLNIQKNYTNAIKDMKKLRDEMDKLLNKTEIMAEKVKEEDSKKIETVSSNCNTLIEQINNITTKLNMQHEKKENERLFISMKRAESQLQSLEESLETLNNDNTVREYKFQPDEKLMARMRDLKVLGHLTFTEQAKNQQVSQTQVTTISKQMLKRPVHVNDINTKLASENDFCMFGSVALPNNQILITDWDHKKVKQFNSIQGTLVSELQVSGVPFDITKVQTDEVAVTVESPNQIQLVSVTQHSLQKGKAIPVNGQCWGIAYNDKDQTFIVTFFNPAKVEIINMTGTVLKTLDKDSTGDQLFSKPYYVALSPDMNGMYISDAGNGSVTLLTLSGDIKAVYKDSKLQYPGGIYVHKSGLVYVVGFHSHTVHLIEPDSGRFKLLLEQKDGLEGPWSISYCEVEDKLYVGMKSNHIVKVFEMK